MNSSIKSPIGIDPDEVRRLVSYGERNGLINPKKVIDKEGNDVTQGDNVVSKWIEVTPEKAAHWLENNVRNRSIKNDVVAAYARDMVNGVWTSTHQGLAFNDRDELIDGQHRLNAIIKSEKTIRMMVTFGLPSEISGQRMTTMDAVDRGCPRSVADQLKVRHGLKKGSIIASVCVLLGGICYGKRTRRLSVGQTLDIYETFKGPIDWYANNRSKKRGFKSAGLLTGFIFASAAHWDDGEASTIKLLYESLMKRDRVYENSPLEHLIEFLESDESLLLMRGVARGVAELVMQAIHLQMKGERISELEFELDGVNRFRGLQPQRVKKVAKIFELPEG